MAPSQYALFTFKHVDKLNTRAYFKFIAQSADGIEVSQEAGEEENTGVTDSESFLVAPDVYALREVSVEEVETGIAYFVGYALAVADRLDNGTSTWQYGVVSSYRFQPDGVYVELLVGMACHEVKLIEDRYLRCSNVVYALAPGSGESPINLSYAELEEIHEDIDVRFKTKRSRVAKTLYGQHIPSSAYDGSRQIPILDPRSLRLSFVRCQYVLDFLTYAGQKKQPPASVRLSQVLTDDPGAESDDDEENDRFVDAHDSVDSAQEVVAADSESDDDLPMSNLESRLRQVRVQPTPPTARSNPSDLRSTLADVIKLSDSNKNQFKPSAHQQTIHKNIVSSLHSGRYPQELMEEVQWAPYVRFCPAPAVMKRIFDLGFGIQGLSILHFKRLDHMERLALASDPVDLNDFSSKAKLKTSTSAQSIFQILSCLQSLVCFARQFYNPYVNEHLDKLVEFFELYGQYHDPDPTACNELVLWANQHLGTLRGYAFRNAVNQFPSDTLFSIRDETLLHIQAAATERKLVALRTNPQKSYNQANPKDNGNGSGNRIEIPGALVRALPKQDGKELCMRHLSKRGCRGLPDGSCYTDTRGHFVPERLPAAVKAFIKNARGTGYRA